VKHIVKHIGTFKSARWGDVQVYSTTYGAESGPLAIVLRTAEGEPLATLSVNMYRPECSHDSRDLPAGHFYVKTWGGQGVLAAEAMRSGLFIECKMPPAQSGFVSAPVWRLAAADPAVQA
jgi:hypothetical protein